METISYEVNSKSVATCFGHLLGELGIETAFVEQEGDWQLKIDEHLAVDFVFTAQGQVTGKNQAMLFYGVTKAFVAKKTNVSTLEQYCARIKERCLMIDIGRKFYSLAALKSLVRSMALFQFTHLQLHFSENEGFRIESERFPEVVSTQHLSKVEVQELIQYAQKYFIEIIPDLDTPGHLEQFLKQHPDWHLPKGEGSKDPRALDILNSEAVAAIYSLYEEYAELFSESHYFHIGADEFIDFDHLEEYPTLLDYGKKKYGPQSSGIEVFIEYVNQTIEFVSQLGFTVRVWNDGFYRSNREEEISLSKNCEISYWTKWNPNMATIESFLEKGYSLINHNDNFFYYVLGEAAGYQYPTYEKISDEFTLTTFAHHQQVEEQALAQTKAIALSIWSDIPDAKTEQEVVEDSFWLLAAINRKVWLDQNEAKDKYVPLFELWKNCSDK